MPTQKDVLARQYLELARRREEGAGTIRGRFSD